MSSFPNSPHLLKGGLVLIDADTARVLRIISLQYNPDSLTRTLQVQAAGGGGGAAVGADALQGPGGRDDQARGRDRRHRPAGVPRPEPQRRWRSASSRSSRCWSLLAHPTSAQLLRVDAEASSGTLEIAPMLAPLALFVWSKSRIVPVRLTDFSHHRGGLRPGAQPDPRQGEPRPARAVGRRPRLRAQGRQPVHGLSADQGAARRQGAGRQLRRARHRRDRLMDPIQAFLQANALVTAALPADQPLLRHRRGAAHAARRHARSPISGAGSCRRRRASRCCSEHVVVGRRPASTISRRSISATRSSTGASATPTARCGPTSWSRRSGGACASPARRRPGSEAMLAKGIQLTPADGAGRADPGAARGDGRARQRRR